MKIMLHSVSNIRKMFPDMKLLFMIRNPINTIWSMMNRKWGYSLSSKELRRFNLEECIRTWNSCTSLALQYSRKKNVYICQFEDLIEEPLKTSMQILRFLRLKDCPRFPNRDQLKLLVLGNLTDRPSFERHPLKWMPSIVFLR